MPRPRSRYRTQIERSKSFAARRARTPALLTEEPGDDNPISAWVEDAYRYTASIDELGYVVNLKAAVIGQCTLVAQELVPSEESGELEWVETKDPRALRVLDAFQPPKGGQGALLRSAAYHQEVAGEQYLYGEHVVDEYGRDAGILWEFLSVLELRRERNGWKRLKNGTSSQSGRSAGSDSPRVVVARFHRRDGAYSGLADSPVRRVLTTCREIALLSQVIEAQAKSQIPAGLLYMPWEFSTGPEDEFENPGVDQETFDELEAELDSHLNTPQNDRAAKSSLNPLLMRGPGVIDGQDGKSYPAKDLMGLVDLGRPLSIVYQEMRLSAIERLGRGLDAPPEIMKGRSSMSGLGGGNVAASMDRDWVTNHVIPAGDELVDSITLAYFRPMLTILEQVPVEDAGRFRLVLDPSSITADADLSGKANEGHDRILVSDDAWRRENGFADADAPDEDERFRREMLQLSEASPAELAPVLLPLAFPDHPEVAAAMTRLLALGAVTAGRPAVPAPGAPPPPAGPPALERGSLVPDRTLGLMLGEADRAVDRAIERAANRVLGRLNGDGKHLRALPKDRVLAEVDGDTLASIGLNASRLFSGAWDELSLCVGQQLAEDMTAGGLDEAEAARRAGIVVNELAAALTAHVAGALAGPLPRAGNGLLVPDELVARALAAADLP